jgi:hypothetical protein
LTADSFGVKLWKSVNGRTLVSIIALLLTQVDFLAWDITPSWCLDLEGSLSDDQIRETLLMYYPGTARTKLERLKTMIGSLPPRQQMYFHCFIQPWGGDPTESKKAETQMHEIYKQDSTLGKKFREEIFPRLNAARYGDEGVSVDQIQGTLLRAYRNLDDKHLKAWRTVVEGLSPNQKALFDDYILLLEMEKTVRNGAGDRLYRRVIADPAEFQKFEGTLKALNKALERQAYMWVMFRSYDESDETLRSYRSDEPQRPPQDRAMTRTTSETLTRSTHFSKGDTTRVDISTEAVIYWYLRRPDGNCSTYYRSPGIFLTGKRKSGESDGRIDENCKPIFDEPKYLDHGLEGSTAH